MKKFAGKIPYYAVVFTSIPSGRDEEGYKLMDLRMEELASEQPGFMGIESYRGAEGRRVTISYWESLEAIKNWKDNPEHKEAQSMGKEKWYVDYTIRICRVDREYSLI